MKRLGVLDWVRGLTLISMILYHGVWDLVYLFDVDWTWFQGAFGLLWQQSICWTFILLSGFCWSLGRSPGKRGIIVFLAGALITALSLLFMPEQRVLFGILTLLGFCMLLMIPLSKWLEWIPAGLGFALSLLLFLLTKRLAEGTLGFGSWTIIRIPEALYHGWFSTFLGLPMEDFFSTDYFPLLPWGFLFTTGFFLYRAYEDYADRRFVQFILHQRIISNGIKPLNVIGRHSLLVYLVHQPAIYMGLALYFQLK